MSPGIRRDVDPKVAALVHALEIQRAELELQNRELRAANEELQRAQTAAAQAGARYRALYELAPPSLVTLRADGTIADANRAAQTLLAARREHLIDRRLAVFVAEPSRAAWAGWLRALFADGSAPELELALGGDAAAVDVRVGAVVVPGEDGPRAVVAIDDVTAARCGEAERRALDRREAALQRRTALAGLAGSFAHDFNNRLMIVLGETDHALAAVGPGTVAAARLGRARRATREAGERARQVLAFAGGLPLRVQPLDPCAFVDSIGPALGAVAGGVPIALDLVRGVPAVAADAAQLRQVLENLTANAAEAMAGRAGSITIAVRAADGAADAGGAGPRVLIEVRDDGAGIDATTRARLGEPYVSTRAPDRGLGFAVADGIVRAHGGALAIASEVGSGTTARVSLPALPVAAAPVRAPVAARPGPSAVEPVAARPRTVLVVDDDPAVQRMIARLVAALGFRVVTAPGAAGALAQLRAQPEIELVVTDFMMPDLDGVDLARFIRTLRPALPIVLVSGYSQIPDGAAKLFAGVLTKPFDLDELRDVLDGVLPAPGPTSDQPETARSPA